MTRTNLSGSLGHSTSSRLGTSTSSVYTHGSTFAAKASGKKSSKVEPVKSLALAAEAARKVHLDVWLFSLSFAQPDNRFASIQEHEQKERKAAISRLAESSRMQALVKKQEEEKAKADEERKQRVRELAERKARAAELERNRKEREAKERKAKEALKVCLYSCQRPTRHVHIR